MVYKRRFIDGMGEWKLKLFIRILKIKGLIVLIVGRDVRRLEFLCIVDKCVKRFSYFGKRWYCLIKLSLRFVLIVLFIGIYLRKMKTCL